MQQTPEQKEKTATEETTKKDTMREISLTAFKIFSMFPLDIPNFNNEDLPNLKLIFNSNPEWQEHIELLLAIWKKLHYSRIINEVAKKTGTDPAQIKDKEKRTPEQYQALLDAIIAEKEKEKQTFLDSKYFQAYVLLDSIEIEQCNEQNRDPEYSYLKQQAILYYFASNNDINPADTDFLTDTQKEDLINTYHSLEAYFLQETGGKEVDNITRGRILFDFVQQQDSKTPEQKQEIITTLQTVIPQSHIMANNSLMHYLQNYPAINAGAFDLPVINKKGKRKKITAYTIVSYEQDSAGALISAKLTEYERQVSDAVISIWEEARKSGLPPEFTTDMIFRAMPGSGDKPSPQQAGAITKTIEKLRKLHIFLDVTEEMRVRGLISDKEEVIYDDNFLSAGRVTRKIKNGGQTVIAYHLHTEPLILSYCKMTNQLITVSPKWLEVKKVKGGKTTKETLSMTQERQAITGYLIRRIAIMKNDRKNKKPTQSNTILFTTLYEDIGVSAPNKFKAADIRKFCFDVLDYYKAEKIITGYEKQTKGRSITGIIIEL